jgi:hypothetical protein
MEGKPRVEKMARTKHHQWLQREIMESVPGGFVVQGSYTTVISDDIKGWNIDSGEVCRYEELSRAN